MPAEGATPGGCQEPCARSASSMGESGGFLIPRFRVRVPGGPQGAHVARPGKGLGGVRGGWFVVVATAGASPGRGRCTATTVHAALVRHGRTSADRGPPAKAEDAGSNPAGRTKPFSRPGCFPCSRRPLFGGHQRQLVQLTTGLRQRFAVGSASTRPSGSSRVEGVDCCRGRRGRVRVDPPGRDRLHPGTGPGPAETPRRKRAAMARVRAEETQAGVPDRTDGAAPATAGPAAAATATAEHRAVLTPIRGGCRGPVRTAPGTGDSGARPQPGGQPRPSRR